MGDETKHFKIQIKGTAYTFRPMPNEDVEKIVTILSMNVSPMKTMKLLTRVLSQSAGDDWDVITDRWMEGDLTTEETTVRLFEKILKRQSKDAPAADDAQ